MGMSVPKRRVIVVGGGAAGMMASIFAGKAGARVTLLERGEKLGKKVYITGKGRCNVTNDCTQWRGIRGSCTVRCRSFRRKT